MKIINVCSNKIGVWWLKEYYTTKEDMIVCPFYLSLDIGSLDESREAFLKKYMEEDYVPSVYQTTEFLKLINQNVRIRIFSSKKNADDYLLVYYICHLLKDRKIPISVIYTTDYNEYACNIAQLNKEEFLCLFDYERNLSTKEVRQFANNWDKLVDENRELRVCVDGTVVSRNYDDYDEIILSILSKIQEENGKCTRCKLVGWLMGYEIISDMSVTMGHFLVNRLIENGKIKIVKCNAEKELDEIVLNN